MTNRQKPVGFRITQNVSVLTFEGTQFEGAEIEVDLNAPLSLYLEAVDTKDNESEAISFFMKWVESVVVAWNLQNAKGEPLAPTSKDAEKVPPLLLTFALERWVGRVTAVPDPLVEASVSTQ